MSRASRGLGDYRKFLLSRLTVTPEFRQFIDDCVSNEIDAARHCYHKIMVHNWTNSPEELFTAFSQYHATSFIPVNITSHGDIISFYTTNLTVIAKTMRLEFMFPFRRNMYNVDILFNDKTSTECFGCEITLEDIVAGIVSRRLSEKLELNLSNFCNDTEFIQMNIHFYKISLLANYKILMIRMGRDTKSLNLCNNNLNDVPSEIINFFASSMVELNLSDNNIKDIMELQKLRGNKLEKLWLEGNPLCDDFLPLDYVKKVVYMVPKIKELDGVLVNFCGTAVPFWRNSVSDESPVTRVIVEKFLLLYFSHYDSQPRKKLHNFYREDAKMTITSCFTDEKEAELPHYQEYCRNIIDPKKRHFVLDGQKFYFKNNEIKGVFCSLPPSYHDTASFTVDTVKLEYFNNSPLMIVVEGVYMEKAPDNKPDRYFSFRRAFILSWYDYGPHFHFEIVNEMFHVQYASEEQIKNCFKVPYRNLNTLMLISPTEEQKNAVLSAYMHITNESLESAERRLQSFEWDIRRAALEFYDQVIDAHQYNGLKKEMKKMLLMEQYNMATPNASELMTLDTNGHADDDDDISDLSSLED